MITNGCQRWREGRASYRPAREVVSTRTLDVSEIATDIEARDFVLDHHYSRSYPAARFRFGLHERGTLVGVAVFSEPMNRASLACLPGDPSASVDLGRVVLLDEVGANAESWFLARCFALLSREGIVGSISFSDDVKRTDASGAVVFPGHVGTIYQALNATYLGRGARGTHRLLPDGRVLSRRAIAKLNTGDRGWRYAADLLLAFGAPPLREGEDRAAWARIAVARVTRPLTHPGNHKYAWCFAKRDRRHLPASKPYPKLAIARAG